MATELEWKTAPNIQAPTFSQTTSYNSFAATANQNSTKYHAWFLVQSLIGANPLNEYDFGSEYTGLWKLKYITSGSSYQSYQDNDNTYATSNLWMDSDKSFNPNKVPGGISVANVSGPSINNANLAYYDPAVTWGNKGYAVLKSPKINEKNYWMTVDMLGCCNNSDFYNRIYLSCDEPNYTVNPVNTRPVATKHFSYFVNDQSINHVILGFANNLGSSTHKHSLSLASDGSFYFYHTTSTSDIFRGLFAFTGLKNYSADDQYPVMEIRTWNDELISNIYAGTSEGPSQRGFTPNSFVNMSQVSGITKQPYSYNWWLDKNVMSRSTTFFKSPRHDGTTGGSTLASSSVGIAQHLVNVWDYTDAFSPLYGQSDINSRYGEMPIIVGSESIPTNNNYRALRGRIPDFKYAPNNLAQGSVRPSSPNFEYVKIGGFWCPWASPRSPTM